MLLQPLRLYLILQAISTVYGRLEIKNSSSLPPSSSYGTLSTLGPDLKATPSSTSIHGLSTTDALGLNASSTVLPTLSHHENLTVDDNAGYPHARNDGYDVRIMGADTYELELRNGKLDFDLCQASACNGRILACYESDTPTNSMSKDPRRLCTEVSSSLCGFQAEIISYNVVYLMGRKSAFIESFFTNDKCQIPLVSTEFSVEQISYDACIPKISGNSMKLIVQAASESCPFIVKGAQLKPKEAPATSIHANESTTEESSSATTIWIVLSSVIFAFALLGLVVFAIWFFKLRHRKAKPAKTQPPEVADPTDKVQTQVQVKDELKNDAVGVKKDLVPSKTGSKLEPPAVVKSKADKPAKVKTADVAPAQPKTTQDTAHQPIDVPPVDPAVWNEKVQTRAKSAMKTFSLRSGKSGKSGQKKPDSALLRLQASNEYRKLEPIHSLSRVYEIYTQSVKEIAHLYPPGRKYSDDLVELLLLVRVDIALEVFQFMSADARKLLVEDGAEFDMKGNAIKVPEQVRRMIRNDGTEEHVKAYLFLAEYGKNFDPTPDILSKLSAPLLFVIALGTRYSDQLREAAIIEMRRHLPIIRKCWSLEERQKCHFPINGIEQACEMDKRTFRKNADLKSHSTSSGREAAFKRQKQRETAERANKRETRR